MPDETRTPSEVEKERAAEAEAALALVTNNKEGQPQGLAAQEGGGLSGVSTTTEMEEKAKQTLGRNTQKFIIKGSLVGSHYQGETITFEEFCKAQNFDKENGKTELLRLIQAGVVERA